MKVPDVIADAVECILVFLPMSRKSTKTIPGPKDNLSDPNPSLTLDQDLVELDQLWLILPSSNVSSVKTSSSVKEKSKTSLLSMIRSFLDDFGIGIYPWRKLIPQWICFLSSHTFCNEYRTRTWAGSLLYLEASSTMEGCCMRSPRTRGAQAYSLFSFAVSKFILITHL